MSTAAQLAANLANAQASTGPKSEEGKNRSSLNALKTGLTGRTVLMPGEEAQAYQDHVCRFIDEFAPANAREEEIVQSLADTRWRLLRIPALESNIYALGQLEFGEKFSIEAVLLPPDSSRRTPFLPTRSNSTISLSRKCASAAASKRKWPN
ncbi:MAG TPA: hypothetical protein VN579_04340 [Bryobacteraceae bacterium]|nr:hypothetical protein [Bryobacteraceae bacterium]